MFLSFHFCSPEPERLLLLAWVRPLPVSWSWFYACSKVQHHGKFGQYQVSSASHNTSLEEGIIVTSVTCHEKERDESHQLWQSRGDQEEDGWWVAPGEAAAGRGRGAGGPGGGLRDVRGGAWLHWADDGGRDTTGQQRAIQGLQREESRICRGVVFTISISHGFKLSTVSRQKIRLQLMSSPHTPTSEDKRPFIHTRHNFSKITILWTHLKCSDFVWSWPELSAEGQPGRQLGGGLRQPDDWDEDVRARVSSAENGGRAGRSHGPQGRPRRPVRDILDQVTQQVHQVDVKLGEILLKVAKKQEESGGRKTWRGGTIHRTFVSPYYMENKSRDWEF